MNKLCSIFFLIALSFPSFAQVNTDSLWTIWTDESLADTTRADALFTYTWEAYLFTNPDSAIVLAQMEYDFAESHGMKSQIFKD
jgi:hypothetical protein